MTKRRGYKPIRRELLKDGQFLSITFPLEREKMGAFSFVVTRSAPLVREYFEMEELEPGEKIDTDKIGEKGHAQQVSDAGDNIFEIDTTRHPWMLYHIGMAWRPDDMRIYWENPNNELLHGWSVDTKVKVGKDKGFVWSQDTRKDGDRFTPTTELESIIAPKITPFIGFENRNENTVKPTLYVYGRCYDVLPINRESVEEAKRVALGDGYRRKLWSYGPLKMSTPTVHDYWGTVAEISKTEFLDVREGFIGGR